MEPKIRTAKKYPEYYPLNKFPDNFIFFVGKNIVYLLATRGEPRLEGPDWEKIFAESIRATWSPSNIGLDDITYGHNAWSAKTVKNPHPGTAKRIRLISGRNAPEYSFGTKKRVDIPPRELGTQILKIYNKRVLQVREKFSHLRNVVLLKSNDLLELAVFEFPTTAYDPDRYSWQWNERGNVEGFDEHNIHRFTWQPHGAQFTIIEDVPPERMAFRVKQPPIVAKDKVLREIKFNRSWITVL